MSDERELGLEMLLAVKSELDVDLDDELIRTCFEIQKKYQYSHNRALSTQAMDRLLEDRVEKCSRKQTKGGD